MYLAALIFNPRVDLDGSAVRQEHVVAVLLGLQGLLMVYLLRVRRTPAARPAPESPRRCNRATFHAPVAAAASVARGQLAAASSGHREAAGPPEPGRGRRAPGLVRQAQARGQAGQGAGPGVRRARESAVPRGLACLWVGAMIVDGGQGAKLDGARELLLTSLACYVL